MQTTSSPQSHTDWSTEHDAESAILEAADYDWCYAQAVVQARNDDDDTTIPTSNTAQHDLKNVTQHANFVCLLRTTCYMIRITTDSWDTTGRVTQLFHHRPCSTDRCLTINTIILFITISSSNS